MYRIIFPLGKILLAIIMFLLGPIKIRGRNNVPRRGGVLVLANHISDVDPAAVGHALPRSAWFMAKSELFDIRFLGKLVRFLRAFPVRRGAPDRAALRKAIDLIHSGECVVIFPEGELSEDGRPIPILPGAALIARQAGAPVVCCGLVGTTRIMPFRSVIPRPAFGGVRIEFGEPKVFGKRSTEHEVVTWVESEFARLTGVPRAAGPAQHIED